ncbi:MAG: P-loop NTPase [Candidatus Krumholzibacteriota bacterium]|nr:P-loop NTPase [Candidatus Krumholzibacteriota bacterium]
MMSGKPDQEKINKRMSLIKHKVLVLSGKGGVGKSTVAVNLAVALASAGKKVGLLDVDIHGPSVPKMLGIENMKIEGTEDSIKPFEVGDNLRVMSIGFLLRNSDEAVIWRGPMKMGVISQFLSDVDWGELDYLVIDSPPGTGDEPLSVVQLIPDAAGAIIVTTPQSVALIDVRKCITFCRQLNLPVLGVIENMSGFVCPHCGKHTEIFSSGGGKLMAEDLDVPFLGLVPIEPRVAQAGDSGQPFVLNHPGTETGKLFANLLAPLLALKKRELETELSAFGNCDTCGKGKETMKIAVPVDSGVVSAHFGHAQKFLFFDIDRSNNSIASPVEKTPPPHEEGVIPEWLRKEGADILITGGLGAKAKQLFGQFGIEVVTGAPPEEPARVVGFYLDGSLKTDSNACGHPDGGGCGSAGGCGGH